MSDFPITIKKAKDVAKLRLGRLPKPGYSVTVGGVFFPPTPPYRVWDYQLDLVNHAGRFYLSTWGRPFITPDMSKFATIEHEKDTRSL